MPWWAWLMLGAGVGVGGAYLWLGWYFRKGMYR
jgi:hypothetical protein